MIDRPPKLRFLDNHSISWSIEKHNSQQLYESSRNPNPSTTDRFGSGIKIIRLKLTGYALGLEVKYVAVFVNKRMPVNQLIVANHLFLDGKSTYHIFAGNCSLATLR